MIQFQVRQEQPWCWQPKAARRFIRDNHPRKLAGCMLQVYDGLTELASDQNGDPRGRWDRDKIADISCISRTLAIRAMKALQKCGLIDEVQNRDGKGHILTPTILIRTHEVDFTTPIPKSRIDTQGSPESNSLRLGFGQQELEEVPCTSKDLKTPHQTIIELHQTAFLAKHNIKPDYKPMDFKAVKDFLARGQSVENYGRIIGNFMAAPGKFTGGHSLKKSCDNWQAYLEGEHGQPSRSDKRLSHSQERSTLSGSDPLAPKI